MIYQPCANPGCHAEAIPKHAHCSFVCADSHAEAAAERLAIVLEQLQAVEERLTAELSAHDTLATGQR